MSLFHRHKYKQVEQVCAWYEVMVEFDHDELGIDRKKNRKMFLDNGWLVIRWSLLLHNIGY